MILYSFQGIKRMVYSIISLDTSAYLLKPLKGCVTRYTLKSLFFTPLQCPL